MFWIILGVGSIAFGLISYYTSFWRSRFYLPLAFLLGFGVSFTPGNPFSIDNLAGRLGMGVVYGVLYLRTSKILVDSLYHKVQ